MAKEIFKTELKRKFPGVFSGLGMRTKAKAKFKDKKKKMQFQYSDRKGMYLWRP